MLSLYQTATNLVFDMDICAPAHPPLNERSAVADWLTHRPAMTAKHSLTIPIGPNQQSSGQRLTSFMAPPGVLRCDIDLMSVPLTEVPLP